MTLIVYKTTPTALPMPSDTNALSVKSKVIQKVKNVSIINPDEVYAIIEKGLAGLGKISVGNVIPKSAKDDVKFMSGT